MDKEFYKQAYAILGEIDKPLERHTQKTMLTQEIKNP